MLLARLLIACHHFAGFVYAAVRRVEATRTTRVDVRQRRGSKPHCSCCGRAAHAPGYDVLAARRFEFIPIWGYAVMLLYAMRRVRASCRGRRRRLSFGTTWGPVCHAVEYVVQWGLEHRELGCLARHWRRRDPHRAEPQRSTRCAPAEARRMVREGYEPVLKKKRWCLLNRHHRGAEQPKSL